MNRKIFIFLLTFISLYTYSKEQNYSYETIAENLSHPWGIAVIDENDLLFTELSGQLRLVEDGLLKPEPIKGCLLYTSPSPRD